MNTVSLCSSNRADMKQTLISTITLLLIKSSISTRCNSFNNVEVIAYPSKGSSYHTFINGCVERPAFENVITQISIKKQNIPRLGRDSVRNMKYLHRINFEDCAINQIDPIAFRNLPNLEIIQIVVNNITRIREGIFNWTPELELLILSRNNIATIEDGAFGNATKLRRVYCDHNNLENWKGEWFTNSTNIEIINFQFNKIKLLPKQAFSNLRRLKQIYFDYNELETIHSEAFINIRELEYLGLRYNKLRSIAPEVFPNPLTIKTMMIDANYFNYLSKDILTKITVKEMTLDGNPWKCPCLNEISLWLHQNNGTIKKSEFCNESTPIPVCSFSSSNSKICTETIDEEASSIFLQSLKKRLPPLDRYCARLD